MKLAQFSRDEFLNEYWAPYPGEHVNIISPTGAGKSWLMYQLLEKYIQRFPHHTPCSFMPKPVDATTEWWASKLGLRNTSEWPPRKKLFQAKPNGYVFWPPHNSRDEKANRAYLSEAFTGAFNDQYERGSSVTLVDDAYLIGVMYGLNELLDRHWIAGRSNHAALWTTLQKPSGTRSGGISSFAYDAPTHLFFGRDNDERNIDRVSEIALSQFNPNELKDVIRHLPVRNINGSAVSDMLYLDRRGPYLATITP